MADPENFGGGGFGAKTSKIRMSSPKLRLIFRPKSEIQTFFSPKIRWSPKKKKKKKKKKVFAKIETDFSGGFVTFRSVGGDASRDGAELFKIRADFSAKIVTFRLVGGDASPPSPPPKSATEGDAYAAETRRIRNAAAIWWIFCSKSCVILLWYGFCPQIWRWRLKKFKKSLHRKI